MQEQITFQLSQEFLAESMPDAASLQKELMLHLKEVQDLLVSYHFKSRGRVFDVKINESSVELLQPLMGKFTVDYAMGQFNACADLDFSERASMEMLVDIDRQNKIVIITGEFIPEREPDEF